MEQKTSPISASDGFIGSFFSLKNKIFWFKKYRKAYKNYLEVAKKVRKKQFPIDGVLKNGDLVRLNTIDHVALFALLESNKNCSYDYASDEITFKTLDDVKIQNPIKLQGIIRNIDAILTFSGIGMYRELPVEGKIVVDVGASIGDTPIYFALRGAKKVIGIEPFPKNFEIAKKNVSQNNLTDVISILLAGCGAEIGTITVDPNYESSMRSKLKNFNEGMAVPVLTLEKIITDNNVIDGILKMDCEGCEYNVIISTPPELLHKFSYIHIEYHAGYKSLKEKLLKSGFEILSLKMDNANTGHVFARRVTKN